MRFERIVSKDKKEPIMALCKLQVIFSVSNITVLDTEKKRRDFSLGKERRSRDPEAHSRALRKRDEAVTQHSAKRPSFFRRV